MTSTGDLLLLVVVGLQLTAEVSSWYQSYQRHILKQFWNNKSAIKLIRMNYKAQSASGEGTDTGSPSATRPYSRFPYCGAHDDAYGLPYCRHCLIHRCQTRVWHLWSYLYLMWRHVWRKIVLMLNVHKFLLVVFGISCFVYSQHGPTYHLGPVEIALVVRPYGANISTKFPIFAN